MRRGNLPHVKTVRSKGHVYLYFDTGEKKNGKKVYKPLPAKNDPRFGSVYASLLGHRTRRDTTLTVGRMVEMFFTSRKFANLAENTQRLYKRYLGNFSASFPTAPAGRFERRDVIAYLRSLEDTPGAQTMTRASIAALYAWGRKEGHVENRPTDDIEDAEGGEHEPWPDELVEAALRCEDDVVRLAVHLLYFTAKRIGDVVAMRWTQFGEDTFTVRVKKTRKDMEIALHPLLKAELEGRTRDLRTILHNRRGQPFKDQALRKRIQKWAAEQGYKIVPHGLRKNAVNALLEVGCSVGEVSAVSDQTLQTIEHYAKRRNATKMSHQAMLKWGGTQNERGNQKENGSGNG